MANERYHCETINQIVTAAICAMRLTNPEYVECAGCKAQELVKKKATEISRASGRSPLRVKNNQTMEVMDMGEERDYGSHHKCKREGCSKFAVKAGECTRHFKETNGIVKQKKEKEKATSPAMKKPAKAPATRSPIEIPRRPDALPPPSPEYTLSINFSSYPKLHERLLAVSISEYRTPEMQLLFLLNQEFEAREAGA